MDHFLLSPDDVPMHITHDHGMSLVDVADQLPDNDHDVQCWLVARGIESTGDPELDSLVMWHEEEHERRETYPAPAWLALRIWVRVSNAMSNEEWQTYQQDRCKIRLPVGHRDAR
jgi:hypothetical protein